jgi:prephenate dehydratase
MSVLRNLPRAGYLGPEGTFSEEALLSAADADQLKPIPRETIRDAVVAVQEGEVDWSLVPIENSIEGSVTVTLDALVAEAGEVEIVGEAILPVRHCLIARVPIEPSEIGVIVSHPHVPGQCTRFLHERLPGARVAAASSTAEAVRLIAEGYEGDVGSPPHSAAIGTRLAADLYGCAVIAEGIQDREDNETRFVWLARNDSARRAPPLRFAIGDRRKTSLVFWGAGADHAGWLVRCLDEFARREVNLTKIESRPMRERLGQYMFFVDLEGSLADDVVSGGVAGLRDMCQHVRVLGSYPTI